MSPNDPRVAKRQAILGLCGYVTTDNGISYHRTPPDHLEWRIETTFPYDRFYAVDASGIVHDAWVQEYPGDAK